MIFLLRLLRGTALLATFSAASLQAVEPFETENLVLYQTDDVLMQRVRSAEKIAEYFKSLEDICREHFRRASEASNLEVVIAVKPGKRSKVWFIPSEATDPTGGLTKLREKLEAVTPVEVHGGPFAFAVRGKILGGVLKPADQTEGGPPMPEEWKTALKDVKGQSIIPDAPLAILWPSKPGEEPLKEDLPATPKEFVTQVLEPLGGKIERPKGWHYNERHGNAYDWTITLEDNGKGGAYTTGVRLQCFTGIEEANGQTAKEFMEEFVKQKKKRRVSKSSKTATPKTWACSPESVWRPKRDRTTFSTPCFGAMAWISRSSPSQALPRSSGTSTSPFLTAWPSSS